MRAVIVTICAALLLALVGVPAANASDSVCGLLTCQQEADGVTLELSQTSKTPVTATSTHHAEQRPREVHTVTPGCPGNDPNTGTAFDMGCANMSDFCETTGQRGAWLVWIWARPIDATSAPTGRWVRVGSVCRSPQQVQATVPGVTRGLVQRAFRQLHFAHPMAHVQPEGNVTLVNLPTFYQVRWPASGFEPGEVARVELLSRTVRLRPRVVSYTYRFGDGTSLGPTGDAGGPYPTGRVRHSYERTGEVPVSIEATYTGDYQLDGGAWEPIDVTVAVIGEPVTVHVRQARARLEASPG